MKINMKKINKHVLAISYFVMPIELYNWIYPNIIPSYDISSMIWKFLTK